MATPPSETDASIVAGNLNASEKESDFMKNLQRLGNFTLGNDNSSENLAETLSGNVGGINFGPLNTSKKLPENLKATGNLKGFSFGPLNTNKKLPEKFPGNLGSSSFKPFDTSENLSEKSSGNLEGLAFGLRNTYGDLPGKPFENSENFNSGIGEDWISEEFSDMPSESFDPFDLLNTSNEVVQAPTSGTPVQFKPTFGVETMRVVKTVTTIHQCINMMKEYSGKSLEELRLEDYKDNRKGKACVISTLQSGGFFVPNLMTTSQAGGFSVPNSTTTSQTGGFSVPNSTTTSQTGGFSDLNFKTTSQSGVLSLPKSTIKSHTEGSFFNLANACANTDTKPSDLKFDATRTSDVSKLSEGLQELLLTGKHSDVTLNVQSKEFSVHKNILSIGSPVFSEMIENKTKENDAGVLSIDVSKLSEGLQELLLTGKHSDVTLNVQSKEFNVHKNILSIGSPVLLEMIENETKGNASRVVNIDDFDPDTFSDFLHFLYTGNTRKLNDENVFKLYVIADKYKVHELSKICVDYMKDNITLQNFCDILTFCVRYDESELTKVTTQFFMEHSTEITVTDNWELFLKNSPDKANELLLKASK